MHVLLLEPDLALAETYKNCLVAAHHNVIVCATAQAAILATDQQLPEVIVLELQLIEHSGIEFLYELRSYAEWQHVPVIIQSHVPASEFTGTWDALAEQLGVGAYLYKPTASLHDLLAQIRRVTAVAVPAVMTPVAA